MYLLRGAQQEVATTNYFRHTHQGIIHHYSQLISPGSVLAAQDVVATMLCKVDLLLSVMTVEEAYLFIRHDEANGCRCVFLLFIEDFAQLSRPLGVREEVCVQLIADGKTELLNNL